MGINICMTVYIHEDCSYSQLRVKGFLQHYQQPKTNIAARESPAQASDTTMTPKEPKAHNQKEKTLITLDFKL